VKQRKVLLVKNIKLWAGILMKCNFFPDVQTHRSVSRNNQYHLKRIVSDDTDYFNIVFILRFLGGFFRQIQL